MVRWGRIGSKGQTQPGLITEDEAARRMHEKLAKGYRRV